MNVSYDSVTGIGQNPLEYIQMANTGITTNGKLVMVAVLSLSILLY